MARPAKAISASTAARTKEDIALRTQIEDQLKDGKLPVAPSWLTPEQAYMFDRIIQHCEHSGILSSVDDYSLTMLCVAMDRLYVLEEQVNENPERIMDREYISARAGFEKTFWRGCQEFCLTPQARAKIGSLAVAARKEKEDPLAAALSAV